MTALIVCGCVYAVVWAALYRVLKRAPYEPDEEDEDAWVTATAWPLIALVGVFLLGIMAYQWLDEALKREGV